MTATKTWKADIGEILVFSFPLLIEQAAVAFMSLMTSYLVSGISDGAVAGVNLVDTLNVLVQHLFLSMMVGATVVISQYTGREDTLRASEAASQAMLSSLAIAVVVSAVLLLFPDQILHIIMGGVEPEVYANGRTYFICAVISFPFLAIYSISAAALRGSGYPTMSLIATVVTNSLFAIFGLVLVMVFRMGIVGVGLALIACRAVGAAVGVFLLKRGNPNLHVIHFLPRKIDWEIQGKVMFIGIPAAIENVLFMVGRLMTQTYAVPLGTIHMTANAICNTLSNFYNIPGNASSQAVMPISGKYLGAGNPEKAKRMTITITVMAMAVLGVLSLVLFVLTDPISAIFTKTPEVQEAIKPVWRVFLCVSPLLWPVSFVIPAMLRTAGDVKYTTVVAITSMLICRVVIGYMLALVIGWGVMGIWLAMMLDWAVRACFFGARYKNDKWRKVKII